MPDSIPDTAPSSLQALVPLDDFYHFGIVVTDLDAAMAEWSAIHGFEWAPVQHREFMVRQPNGVVLADFRFTYSIAGPPHIEFIKAAPGTVWDPSTAGGVHHLGYWSHDLVADAQRLAEAGYEPLSSYDSADGRPLGFTYHWLPTTGLRVELVDAARRQDFLNWLAGADFPAATDR
ncbi:MAG: VOC family protein [Acidimicrobiia bacterium]|nr:VOC family protein [Acidimicrobiia bacterium]MYG57605.1 VOC family protein [Acidimicrobiia bacterium]MYJ31268.1 VOC family protein [Acidimicrobiia bacterium]